MSKHLFFNGVITAITPLTMSYAHKKEGGKVSRFPKGLGDAPYYPATGFLGRLRRAGYAEIRDAMRRNGIEHPFSERDFYTLAMGGLQFIKGDTRWDPENDVNMRLARPFESLMGSVRMAAKLGVGNLYPTVPFSAENKLPILSGVRTNEFQRNPEAREFFSLEEQQKMLDRLVANGAASKASGESKKEIEALRREAKRLDNAGEKDAARAARDKAAELQASAKAERLESGGNSVQNMWDGYEYIPEGTLLNHKMSATNLTEDELAMLMGSLRAMVLEPRLGGHAHHNAGWIDATWEILTREPRSYGPATRVGSVRVSRDAGFVLSDESADKFLENGLARFDEMMANNFEGLVFDGVDVIEVKGKGDDNDEE